MIWCNKSYNIWDKGSEIMFPGKRKLPIFSLVRIFSAKSGAVTGKKQYLCAVNCAIYNNVCIKSKSKRQ